MVNNINVPCTDACISTIINATDMKFSQYYCATVLHIPLYFGKNPMKTSILICIVKDSR